MTTHWNFVVGTTVCVWCSSSSRICRSGGCSLRRLHTLMLSSSIFSCRNWDFSHPLSSSKSLPRPISSYSMSTTSFFPSLDGSIFTIQLGYIYRTVLRVIHLWCTCIHNGEHTHIILKSILLTVEFIHNTNMFCSHIDLSPCFFMDTKTAVKHNIRSHCPLITYDS